MRNHFAAAVCGNCVRLVVSEKGNKGFTKCNMAGKSPFCHVHPKIDNKPIHGVMKSQYSTHTAHPFQPTARLPYPVALAFATLPVCLNYDALECRITVVVLPCSFRKRPTFNSVIPSTNVKVTRFTSALRQC